jgi:AraC-like DNA-binding protein
LTPETTPALYAIKLVDVLREEHLDYQALLRGCGFTVRETAEPEREIPIEKYLLLVAAAVDASGLDDLGFRVGEHTGTLEHGALGYALLSSKTLGESLERYTRYQQVVGPLQTISLETSELHAVMTAQPHSGKRELSLTMQRYFLQEWLASWNPWCPLIGRKGSFFTRVSIGLPDHELAELYRRHLGCPVDFREGPSLAYFPADHLQLPLRFSDARTGAFCHEQCELLLQAIAAQHGLTAEIHRQLAHIPGHLPDMDEVAQNLGMTSRTLRRHLQTEETTFQDIVIAHRIGMAKRYLVETSITTNEIAELVGYADPANFYRMFRREEGVTPARLREAVSHSP